MKMTYRSLAVGAAALIAGIGAAGQAQAAPLLDTFYLDAHEVQAPGDKYAGPASSSTFALSILPRVVTVSGTVSLWAKNNWNSPRFQICGTPNSEPRFGSPGVADGKVGVDAVGRFALVRKPSGACPSLPDKSGGNFQFNVGNGWQTLTPFLSVGHTHSYLVPITDNRIRVRLFDPAAYDNYGRFRVTVFPNVLGL